MSQPATLAEAEVPYSEDFAAWAEQQARFLREGRFRSLDIENLTDEIESLSRSQFRDLVSALAVVLHHMLKWDHQAERRSRSWILSIREHRRRVLLELADSPSFRSRLNRAIQLAYQDGRDRSAAETDLPLKTFPLLCPYSWDDIMERPFGDEEFGG